MGKITVIGSMNMDLVANVDHMPKTGETIIGKSFEEIPGGKGANQAVAMARLGGQVNMIGKLGDDGFGKTLLKGLQKDEISVEGVQIEENTPSGVALITVSKEAHNSIIVVPGANFKLKKEDIDRNIQIIKESDFLVLQLEVPIDTVKHSLKRAKDLGVYTILNPAPAQKLDKSIIENVDLLIPNETELEILSGIEINNEEDVIKASKSLIEKGVESLIVTLGEKGSMYIDEKGFKKFKAHKVKAVDTTAAGDSFIGGVCVSLSEGKTIEEAIGYGSKVGALTVTKKGAQSSLPYKEEIEALKEA
ncbi:ribokinase [Inediibacterium massiliense]|uniref:ribokinase n=1 Tax=Inediibacterium massiliense TaxID=1658111 RepID=UPI0006B4A3B1|nr:ribokinase [Inediibacterium massiliense]